MDLGYSLLLREFITAAEVDYGDCQQFQITCPACHEAVFKAGKYGQDRQYFSHYAASKSDPKQCELRVAAITREAIQEKNILGHGQSMEQFFIKFRGFVVDWLYGNDDIKMRRRINWMVARPTFVLYAARVGSFSKTSFDSKHNLHELLATELAEHRSSFWLVRQAGFAMDFIEHLFAPNSGAALAFAVAVAIALTPLDLEVQRALMEAPDKTLLRQLSIIQKRPHFEHYNAMIMRSFGLLMLAIPYIEMLNDGIEDRRDRDLLLNLTTDFYNELRDPDNYVPLPPGQAFAADK